jgi:hypothetical protein
VLDAPSPALVPVLLARDTLTWLRQLADDTRVNANRVAFDASGRPGPDAFATFMAQRDHAVQAALVVMACDAALRQPDPVALQRVAQHGGAAHA